MAYFKKGLGLDISDRGSMEAQMRSISANDNYAHPARLGVSTLAAARRQILPDRSAAERLRSPQQRCRIMMDTTDNDTLGSVPDASMLSLFRSLVTFLTEEAQSRGWEEVSVRLRAVEGALSGQQTVDSAAG